MPVGNSPKIIVLALKRQHRYMVNDRFIELLTRKLTEEIDEAEDAELRGVLESDAECRYQYNFFKSYWNHEEQKYSNSDLMFQKIRERIGVCAAVDEQKRSGKIRSISWFFKSVAAVILVISVTSAFFYFHKPLPSYGKAVASKLQVIQTPSRVKTKIALSDGTVITLNSETTLKYPLIFNGPVREVYLNGEAFFDVAKDRAHPFIVHTGKMNVRVLGTAFNIKSYSNDPNIETTLIRGTIEVTLADRPADRIIMKPNEKLILNNMSFRKLRAKDHLSPLTATAVYTNYSLTGLTYLKPNDTTIVETSWLNNKLVFKDEDFTELANRMERWYGVNIKFKVDSVRNYRFTGTFEKESLPQALNALKMIESFDYKYKNETVYIY